MFNSRLKLTACAKIVPTKDSYEKGRYHISGGVIFLSSVSPLPRAAKSARLFIWFVTNSLVTKYNFEKYFLKFLRKAFCEKTFLLTTYRKRI